MSKPFGRTTTEDLYMAIDDLQKQVNGLLNRKDIVAPGRLATRLPPGQEGQLVIADPSGIGQTQTLYFYYGGQWQEIGAGSGGTIACSNWFYVGDPTVSAQVPPTATDSYGTLLTTLIAGNPTMAGLTVFPLLNSWQSSLGLDAPLRFFTFGCNCFIDGGGTGGLVNTAMWNFPVTMRPKYQRPMIVPTGTPGSYVTVRIMPNGDVVYLG